mgnify:CR=1 FL=1
MGIYLNPSNANFAGILKNPLYVDKTMMLSELNRFIDIDNKYICISRPRRFGKTIAGNMIAAYYSKGCDSRNLFAPYKIVADKAFADKLPAISFFDDDAIADCIVKVFSVTGEQFVVIMDEYDVLVREEVEPSLFTQYLDLLNGLFKSNTVRPAIALAYLTGILPVVRDKVQSKLNNFEEYTILDAGEFAEYIGFTAEEVKELCKKHGIDFSECKRWYDGYTQHGFEIYNPESVIKSIQKKAFEGL